MSKKASSTCPVCCKAFNDSTHLPLSTSCQHTHCLACLREHTLASHPGIEAPRVDQVPTGREIECLKCQKRVSTDDLVIDRAALASVPLSLEDLIIADDSPPKPRPSKSSTATKTTTASKKQPQDPTYDPGSTLHAAYDLGPSTQDDRHKGDQASSIHIQTDLHQGPIGWTQPTSLPPEDLAMDPHHPQHPHSQPGVVGWTAPPGHEYPQVPPHSGPYTHMPQPHGHAPHSHYDPHHAHGHHPHGHSHSHHGHVAAAGAAGVAAGVGVTALATHKKKKNKKEKKKHKEGKKSKEGRHRSSSSSSSSSGSSRSSKSSNSS